VTLLSVTISTTAPSTPIRLAIVNDYSVVLAGLHAMLEPYRDRIAVIELDANMAVAQDVDLVLYDTFARPEPDFAELRLLAANPHARRVVVFSWSADPKLIELALSLGAAGYLSKTSSAPEIVEALEAVVAGDTVTTPRPGRLQRNPRLSWPGQSDELTARESEVLALITQGKTNAEICGLLHLSINTIKGNIRTAYRKIGASNRVEAVLWGTDNGMRPDQERIRIWSVPEQTGATEEAPNRR
jgi:DNA-binding NarL/FixJ family response regulator